MVTWDPAQGTVDYARCLVWALRFAVYYIIFLWYGSWVEFPELSGFRLICQVPGGVPEKCGASSVSFLLAGA